MKEIILDPFYSTILFAIGITTFCLLESASKNRKINLILRQTTIFLFLFTGLNVSIFPFSYLYPEALAGIDKTIASATLQISVYGSFVFILRSWFVSLFKNTAKIRKNPFLSALIIYLLLTWAWSETPLLSFKLGLVISLTSLLSAHFAISLNWEKLADLLRLVILLATIVSLLLIALSPSAAFVGKGFTGIFPFPIRFGTCLSLCIGLNSIQILSGKTRWWTIPITAVLLVVLTFTNSGQGFVTCFVLVSLIIVLKLTHKLHPKYVPTLITFYLMISVLLFSSLDFITIKILNTLGKDPTLTGRTEFWHQLFERISSRPLWGYGLGGFWQPWRSSENPANGIINANGFIPPNAHSGFIDLLLQLGLVGFLLFSAALIFGFVQATRYWIKHKSLPGAIPLMILLYIVLANVSETQLIGSNYIWMLFVMTLTLLNVNSQDENFGRDFIRNVGTSKRSKYLHHS